MPPRLFRRRNPPPKPETPAAQKHLERPSAQDIFEQVAQNARQELGRSSVSLAISGFAGGIFMGLSALGNAIAIAVLTPLGAPASHVALFVGKMFYPLGFIVVILGRAQLFTENTLYPVALVLAEKNHFWNTMRLWAIVLCFNVLGALAFATLAVRTTALPGPVMQWLVELGLEAGNHPAATIFWSVMIIWMLALVGGLGNFAHCIAGAGEVFAPALAGRAPWSSFAHWFLPAVAGNICGGVGMVTLLEYGQVIIGKDAEAEALPPAEKEEPPRDQAA